MNFNVVNKVKNLNKNILVVAMDHTLYYGKQPGLENTKTVIKSLIDQDVDGYITSPAIARQCLEDPNLPSTTFIPRVDYYLSNKSVPYGFNQEEYCIITSAQALKDIGANAAIISLVFGYNNSAAQIKNIASVATFAEDCLKVNLPLIVETVMWGNRVEKSEEANVENIASIVKMGAELGASMIKAPYFGTPEEYAMVVRECPVPLGILGGARADSDDEVVQVVKNGIEAGAKGVFFGRNIWQAENPKLMVEKLLNVLRSKEDLGITIM
jgi:DhnA family fructose-bisphosphate aldolase class Ia